MVESVGIRRLAVLTACVLIAATVWWAPDPDKSLRSAIAINDFGHVVAFGLVMALLVFTFPTHRHWGFQRRMHVAGLFAGAALGLGAAVELLQAVTGGNGDPWDVLRDAAGVVIVALIWLARDSTISTQLRTALLALAVLALAPFAFPTVAALSDEALAYRQFPVLAGFQSERELSRFTFAASSGARLITTSDDQSRLVPAVELQLPPGKYPSFALSHFPGDWHGMRTLRLLLVNPEPAPFEIWVRIDDAHYDYKLDLADRYSESFMLMPGANRIEIPLTHVAAAPRGRRLDLGRVDLLLIYAVDLVQPRRIVVGPMALMP